jgi:hypothetical protein
MAKGTGTMDSDRPGRELKKEFREVATALVSNQGWRYDNGSRRGGHPVLYPADLSQPPLAVPTTPGKGRAFTNFVAEVRRRGGIWP